MSEQAVTDLYEPWEKRKKIQAHADYLEEIIKYAKGEDDGVEFFDGTGWTMLSLLLDLSGLRLAQFFHKVLRNWDPPKSELVALSTELCEKNGYFSGHDDDKAGVVISYLITRGLIGNTREEIMAEATRAREFRHMTFVCTQCGKVPFIMMPDELTEPCSAGEYHHYVVKDPGSMVQYVVGQRFIHEMMVAEAEQIG